MNKITLKKYIETIGMNKSADLFDCSLHTIRAWRWGHRQPGVDKARIIIEKTNYVLDFESIYYR